MAESAIKANSRRRTSIPVPRPLWMFLATIVLVAATAGLQVAVPVARQLSSVEEIESLGGAAHLTAGGPAWLRSWLRDERLTGFDEFTVVSLAHTDASDATIGRMERVAQLTHLNLEKTAISDAALASLTRATNLKELILDGTKVTDAGLDHLSRLEQLETLSVCETKVGDAGLAKLKLLKNLKQLYLSRTQVTSTGVSELESALPQLDVWKLVERQPDSDWFQRSTGGMYGGGFF